MPIWAYIYCGFCILGTCLALNDKRRLQRSYQPAGEILNGVCTIAVFLIAYQVILLSHAPLISTLCFAYTVFWAVHAHRQLLNFHYFRQEQHEWARNAHENALKDYNKKRQEAVDKGNEGWPDMDEIEEAYDPEQTDRTARIGYVFIILFTILLTLPYVYVYLTSVGVFGS